MLQLLMQMGCSLYHCPFTVHLVHCLTLPHILVCFCRPMCRSINLMRWTCHIPGKPDTDWEGGAYSLTLIFPQDYPNRPPEVKEH